MSLTISIPNTSEHLGPGKAYTLYHVLVRLPVRSYAVKKRYNDFVSLHDSLTKHTGRAPPLPLPPKRYIGSTVGNPTRTEERRGALEAYLAAILTVEDSRWRDSPAWRAFLSLPASWSNLVAHAPGATPSGPITDPRAWLESHRELMSLLHEARIALSKRDQAVQAAEQHEASAAAKRCLVKASSIIKALDSGLKKANNWSKGAEKQLLDGEIRRRKDLVATARQERDALEALANTLSVKRNASAAADAPPSDKAALFGPATTRRAAGGAGGRVLGGPLPETARTREMDNKGVLQLQQQILQQQDQGVQNLIKVVQRQKNMGIAINEELEFQNRMLDELNEDVTRVDKKTRLAGKKTDNIS